MFPVHSAGKIESPQTASDRRHRRRRTATKSRLKLQTPDGGTMRPKIRNRHLNRRDFFSHLTLAAGVITGMGSTLLGKNSVNVADTTSGKIGGRLIDEVIA